MRKFVEMDADIDWTKPGIYQIGLPDGLTGTLIVGKYHTDDDFYQRMIRAVQAMTYFQVDGSLHVATGDEVYSFHPQQEFGG